MANKKTIGKDEGKSPFVAIPASLGGIIIAIVVLFLLFAPDSLRYMTSVVWGLVVLGGFSLYFAHSASKKE